MNKSILMMVLGTIAAGISTAQAPSVTFMSYQVGSTPGLVDIALGPDGAMWFVEALANKIGRITAAGEITEYTPPNAPQAIVAGPDEALWFTEPSVRQIGRITTRGVISEFALPCCGSPSHIAAGPDGALWFTQNTNKIGRITTGGVVSEYALPDPNSGATGITAGPDGALWFTEYLKFTVIFGNRVLEKIGRITT